MKWIEILLIKFYKRFISPSLRERCIYTPTCSMYMMTAIKKHGAIKGLFMGMARLLRCSPFYQGGYDPVVENYRGNAKWLM